MGAGHSTQLAADCITTTACTLSRQPRVAAQPTCAWQRYLSVTWQVAHWACVTVSPAPEGTHRRQEYRRHEQPSWHCSVFLADCWEPDPLPVLSAAVPRGHHSRHSAGLERHMARCMTRARRITAEDSTAQRAEGATRVSPVPDMAERDPLTAITQPSLRVDVCTPTLLYRNTGPHSTGACISCCSKVARTRPAARDVYQHGTCFSTTVPQTRGGRYPHQLGDHAMKCDPNAPTESPVCDLPPHELA